MEDISDMATMRAAVLREHGDVEGVSVEEEYPRPEPAAGEVVVKVRATSLNFHDIFTVNGMPGITIPLPVIPGLDVVGDVEALGEGVTGWSVGDRVVVNPMLGPDLMGETRDGGLAQYATAEAERLIALPDNVTYEQAAALPVAYGTAHRMIVDKQTIKAGDKVLVLGASGGVGTASVLLAKHLGAHVVAAVGSDEKGERLLELGADQYVNYRETDFARWTRENLGKPQRFDDSTGFDVIVNFTGGDTWKPTLKSVKLGGKILVCGATAGFDPAEDLRYIYSFEIQVIGSNGFRDRDIAGLLELVSSGAIDPVIDEVLPLDRTVEALQRVRDRGMIGKVVISPWA
jgi:alcohol dehydrogenase